MSADRRLLDKQREAILYSLEHPDINRSRLIVARQQVANLKQAGAHEPSQLNQLEADYAEAEKMLREARLLFEHARDSLANCKALSQALREEEWLTGMVERPKDLLDDIDRQIASLNHISQLEQIKRLEAEIARLKNGT